MIYNPLQYSGESFSSRVLGTVKEQAEKKQASLDQMNETLRTEAAQGRLGSLANDILNDALTQASEQGLIGVNQYDIMNKAMPKFYAAKSAVTELNNAHDAELKAAQADESINVDANFLAYLNNKYYAEDVTLDNIDAFAANAVNKGFNIAEHTEFLNDQYVLDKVLPTMVDEFSKSEYGQIGEQNGMAVFGTTTTTGVARATADNITNFTANPQVEALLIKKAREANPDVDITSLNLQVPKADQARLLNEVLDAKFPSTSTIAGAGIGERDKSELARKRAISIQASAFYRDMNDRQKINWNAEQMTTYMQDNEGATVNDAYNYLRSLRDEEDKPIYNQNYLADAANQLKGRTQKSYADEREYLKMEKGANLLYEDAAFDTEQGLLSLNGRAFGKVMTSVEKTKDGDLEVLITRGSEEMHSEPIVIKVENGTPNSDQVAALQNALVSHAYDDMFVRRGEGTSNPTQPKRKTEKKDDMVGGWDADSQQ
jgi:hypothetical protein